MLRSSKRRSVEKEKGRSHLTTKVGTGCVDKMYKTKKVDDPGYSTTMSQVLMKKKK